MIKLSNLDPRVAAYALPYWPRTLARFWPWLRVQARDVVGDALVDLGLVLAVGLGQVRKVLAGFVLVVGLGLAAGLRIVRLCRASVGLEARDRIARRRNIAGISIRKLPAPLRLALYPVQAIGSKAVCKFLVAARVGSRQSSASDT